MKEIILIYTNGPLDRLDKRFTQNNRAETRAKGNVLYSLRRKDYLYYEKTNKTHAYFFFWLYEQRRYQ
jgi:hypothetical protein